MRLVRRCRACLAIQSSSPRTLPWGFVESDRVLIGGPTTEEGAAAAEVLADIYAKWAPQERIMMSNLLSSELSKLVANTMLAPRVSR